MQSTTRGEAGENGITSLVDESGRYSYERVQEAKRNLVERWNQAFGVLADVADVLRENPRVPEKELFNQVNGRLKELDEKGDRGLGWLVGTLFLRLSHKHRLVVDFHDSLKGDGRRAYTELFGFPPLGHVEVRLGPACLNVFCCKEDLKHALTGAKYVKSDPQSDVEKLAGVNMKSCLIPALSGSVNVIFDGDPMLERVVVHEETHALFNLVSMEPQETFNLAFKRLKESLDSGDPEQISHWLMNHLRFLRSGVEPLAANEILAYAADARFSREQIVNILMQPSHEEGLYDFTGNYLDIGEKGDGRKLLNFLKEIGVEGVLGQERLEFCVGMVFDYEFRNLIAQGLVAFYRLKSRGYTNADILLHLSRFPLRRWRQISCRIAEQTPIPFNNFVVRSFMESDTPVVVLDTRGRLLCDDHVRLLGYKNDRNETAILSYDNPDNATVQIPRMTREELRALNYPYKTPKDWYDIWVRAGGDPKVKDELDLSSQALVPATEIWGTFRKYARLGNELSVFRAYRRIQREAF